MLMSAHALLLDQEASLDFYSTKNMYKFGDKTHQTWKHKKLSFTKKKCISFVTKTHQQKT